MGEARRKKMVVNGRKAVKAEVAATEQPKKSNYNIVVGGGRFRLPLVLNGLMDFIRMGNGGSGK